MVRWIIWIWIACMFIVGFSQPADAAGLLVTVHAEAEVKGPMITLGELAAISGDDSSQARPLREIELGSAPLPGSRMVLTREMLAARLRAAGVDSTGANWQIPPQINITAQAQTVSSQQLQDTAQQYLEKQLDTLTGTDAEISIMTQPADLLVPPGNLVLAGEIPYGIRAGAPTLVAVTVLVDGRLYTKKVVRFEVKQYRQILVAARQLTVGEALALENVKYERVDTSRLTQGYFTDFDKLLGMSVKRPIPQGTPINSAMLVKPIVIKRGSAITIMVQSAGIEVSVAGQALQDGTVGQIIKVQNQLSQKIVSAKVVNDTTVLAVSYGR